MLAPNFMGLYAPNQGPVGIASPTSTGFPGIYGANPTQPVHPVNQAAAPNQDYWSMLLPRLQAYLADWQKKNAATAPTNPYNPWGGAEINGAGPNRDSNGNPTNAETQAAENVAGVFGVAADR